ncbi:MAG TPA: (2Fe-2S)-binding protein [Herpetosiphonaceae bacterium]
MPDQHPITLTVNGVTYARSVEPRLTLADCLREDLELTGTHLGCEQGICGACTVLLNGEAVRSCLMLAVQADGQTITTIEGLAPDGRLTPLMRALRAHHGLQCGFCTPGIVVQMSSFLDTNPHPTEAEIRRALAGHLCRCTGYQGIVDAVLACAQRSMAHDESGAGSR